jgi:hypothetical protein
MQEHVVIEGNGMKRFLFFLVTGLFLVGVSSASAAIIDLWDYAYNIDGTVSAPLWGDPVPAAADENLFDDSTGLGSITVTISGAGAHYVSLFVDHEIDTSENGLDNENGSATGTPAVGLSWEIDEPGYFDGDIWDNFSGSTLDNGIGTSVYGDTTFPEDVSMALGWDFSLDAGETALITFLLAEAAPNGFYLTHFDPDTDGSVFFSSSLNIRGGGPPGVIPEPGTMLLFGTGLLGFAGVGRKKIQNK